MTLTCQIRLENNIILTIQLHHENDLIRNLQKSLYQSRMYLHPDVIAAEIARECRVTTIGKREGKRDIFVDIDALDTVLSISKRLPDGLEVCVYADTFKEFLKHLPEQIKAEWNANLRDERIKNASCAGGQNDTTN